MKSQNSYSNTNFPIKASQFLAFCKGFLPGYFLESGKDISENPMYIYAIKNSLFYSLSLLVVS